MKKRHSRHIKGLSAITVVLLFTLAGVEILNISHAQSPYVSVGVGSGSIEPPATLHNDTNPNGSNYVQFGTTSPPINNDNDIVIGLDTPPSNISTAISEIGKTPTVINEFDNWQTDSGATIPFPTTDVNSDIAMGVTPMITWQPNLTTWQTTSVLNSITDGSQDSYISAWAEAAKAENHTLYLRLMHEFNGDWYPWGKVTAGVTPLINNQFSKNDPPPGDYPYTNTSQMYVAAFQHVYNIFQQVGATNVQFMWCFATSADISNISSYYPGNSVVSWASMDGYNKSTTSPTSFSQIFNSGYNSILSFSNRPIYIAETASVEFSGLSSDPTSKAVWITDGFLNAIPNSFPRIKGINYFDSVGAGYTYPIDSSSSTLAAIKQVYSNSYYQGAAPTTTLSF